MKINIKIDKPDIDPDIINNKILEVSKIWAFEIENKVKLDLTGVKLGLRSGKLRSDIKSEVKQTRNKTKIKIGSRKIPYSKIQDDKDKTSITTQSRQWLTVPVNRTIKGKARQYSNTFFILNPKTGNLLLVKKTKKGIKPLFTLKKFVTIQGVGYLTDNVNDNIIFLEQDLFKSIDSIKI